MGYPTILFLAKLHTILVMSLIIAFIAYKLYKYIPKKYRDMKDKKKAVKIIKGDAEKARIIIKIAELEENLKQKKDIF
jgi:hypothetical protein